MQKQTETSGSSTGKIWAVVLAVILLLALVWAFYADSGPGNIF